MMPSGVAMMLKAMGIDPEQVMNTVNETAVAIKSGVETLQRVEAKLDRVLALSNIPDAELSEVDNGENRHRNSGGTA